MLKVPTQFREASFVESIFIACCVLHNMLLHHDKQFQDGNFRVGVATNLPRHRRRTILINNVRRLLKQNDDFSVCGGCSDYLKVKLRSRSLEFERRVVKNGRCTSAGVPACRNETARIIALRAAACTRACQSGRSRRQC